MSNNLDFVRFYLLVYNLWKREKKKLTLNYGNLKDELG